MTERARAQGSRLRLIGGLWAAQSLAALVLAPVAMHDARVLGGLTLGLLLFGLNGLLLCSVALWTLKEAVASPSGGRATLRLALVVGGKLLILGGGSYVALVPLGLSVWAFVTGCTVALVFLSVAVITAESLAKRAWAR